MTVTFENGTLKVLLSEAETVIYRLDGLLFGNDIKSSKSALANLYKTALQKIPQKPFSERILIEIHPFFGGGCEIFFTPDSNRIPAKTKQPKPSFTIIEIYTSEDMIETVNRLYFGVKTSVESRLYIKNGIYRIVLTATDEKALIPSLYGIKCRKITSKIQVAVTKEHWNLLCDNPCIDTIYKAFFKEP